jgi:hypothetical protein
LQWHFTCQPISNVNPCPLPDTFSISLPCLHSHLIILSCILSLSLH